MGFKDLNSQQSAFPWSIIIIYLFFMASITGLLNFWNLKILNLIALLSVLIIPGMMVMKVIIIQDLEYLKTFELFTVSFLVSVLMIAVVGTFSFVLWPLHVILATRIILVLITSLMVVIILVFGKSKYLTPLWVIKNQIKMIRLNWSEIIVLTWLMSLLIIIFVAVIFPRNKEGFSEFYFSESKLDQCPDSMVQREPTCLYINLGVVNHENQSIIYSINLQTPVTYTIENISLSTGETRNFSFVIPGSACHRSQKLGFDLVKEDYTKPYRSIWLECDLLLSEFYNN